MKGRLPLYALGSLLACLTSCSDTHTTIDGDSLDSCLESAADLKAVLPKEQRPLFEHSLTHLQRDQDFSALDGMNAEEILEAEVDRLTDVKAGRVAKLEKFEGYKRKFTEQGSEAPENILTTLREVKDHIRSIDLKLEALGIEIVGGPGSATDEDGGDGPDNSAAE